MATLSLRRLWVIYKRTAMKEGSTRRERINTQLPFTAGHGEYSESWRTSLEHGQYEELHATIRRHGRLLERIHGRRLRAKRH